MHKQLGIFEEVIGKFFSNLPCIICDSHTEVLAVLFQVPGTKFHKLAYLCSTCRGNPAIVGK